MSKMKGAVSHDEAEISELRADRQLAVAYLKAAMEALDNPDELAGGLLALGGTVAGWVTSSWGRANTTTPRTWVALHRNHPHFLPLPAFVSATQNSRHIPQFPQPSNWGN